MKTKKALKRRFRLTGTGKLKRGQEGMRHLLSKKKTNKKRKLQKSTLVRDTHLKKYKQLMGGRD